MYYVELLSLVIAFGVAWMLPLRSGANITPPDPEPASDIEAIDQDLESKAYILSFNRAS